MNIFKKYKQYLQDNPKGYWFKRKGYGWGWTPVTWQGWSITGVYIALILLFALTIDNESPIKEVLFTFIIPFILLTLAFTSIAYKKGESPKWQWGFPDKTEDDK